MKYGINWCYTVLLENKETRESVEWEFRRKSEADGVYTAVKQALFTTSADHWVLCLYNPSGEVVDNIIVG